MPDQHDTLDQIIAKALHDKLGEYTHGAGYRLEMVHYTDVAAAVRDALIAEGIVTPADNGGGLVLVLPVGVGCGNAKKDTP